MRKGLVWCAAVMRLFRSIEEKHGVEQPGYEPPGDTPALTTRIAAAEQSAASRPKEIEPRASAAQARSGKRRPLLATLAVFAIIIAIVSAGSKGSHMGAAHKISKDSAEALWLKIFVPLVEAHGAGEKAQTLHSPGVEYSCTAKGDGYECLGIVPEEEGIPWRDWLPRHEERCDYATMRINRNGHVTEESARPISEYREAFHVAVECHL